MLKRKINSHRDEKNNNEIILNKKRKKKMKGRKKTKKQGANYLPFQYPGPSKRTFTGRPLEKQNVNWGYGTLAHVATCPPLSAAYCCHPQVSREPVGWWLRFTG